MINIDQFKKFSCITVYIYSKKLPEELFSVISYMTKRHAVNLFSLVVMMCGLLAGSLQASIFNRDSNPAITNKPQQQFVATSRNKTHSSNEYIWSYINRHSSIDTNKFTSKKLVDKHIKNISKQRHGLTTITKYAQPYLYHIVNEVKRFNLPIELSFIPVIESSFKVHERSHLGAMGLWQIMPTTGKSLGLKRDGWVDDAKDVIKSTDAALTYIDRNFKDFNGDILKAVAAYHCGPGGVRKAERKNKKLGRSTDFWSLDVPKSTKDYVAKWLAVSHVIKNNKKYKVNLAEIHNKPYFKVVEFKQQTNIVKVAHKHKIDVDRVKKLNAGLSKNVTHPKGPHLVVLPL